MTCVATNGRVMAGDGRLHIADLLQTDQAVKIGHAKDGSVVGVAGEAGGIAKVLKWFADGEVADCLPELRAGANEESAFEALILRPDGSGWRMDDTFGPTRIDLPCAIGSGGPIATAAMHCGRTPEQAVVLAARLVLTVGGKITTLRPSKPRKPSK